MNGGNLNTVLPDRAAWPRWLYPAIAAALIAAFILQALLSMGALSATIDEPTYIKAGYSYWKTREGRLNYGHPPMMKLLIAIPLLLSTSRSSRVTSPDVSFAEVSYRELGDAALYRSRIPIVFMGALLAVFVGKWAAELWGAEAGLAALLLFAFDPNILAHSRLATLDVGLAAFTFISMYYVWKWLVTRRMGYAVLACTALGFSLLSKATALAFLPILLAEFVLDHAPATHRGLARYVAAVTGFLRLVAGAAVVVVAVYAVAFHWHPLLSADGEHRTVSRILARIAALSGAGQAQIVAQAQRIWIPDVDKYVSGLVDQRRHLIQGHSSYLIGRHSLHGWWFYYPVAFLIKTPIPILLLLILRLFRLGSVPMAAGEYVLVLPIIGTMILACFDTVDNGLRHILPLYPFLFVWLSRIVALELIGSQEQTGLPLT